MIFGLYEIGARCDQARLSDNLCVESRTFVNVIYSTICSLPLIWSAPHKIVSCLLVNVFLVLSAAVQGTVSFQGKLLLYSNFAQQIYIG